MRSDWWITTGIINSMNHDRTDRTKGDPENERLDF